MHKNAKETENVNKVLIRCKVLKLEIEKWNKKKEIYFSRIWNFISYFKFIIFVLSKLKMLSIIIHFYEN